MLSVFDVDLDQATPYIVFELLEGETLRQRLQRGHLPWRKAVEYAIQIADGLAAAHAKGILHRDLKPDNLFLTRDGGVKILDFGVAKLTQDEGGADGEGGTPARTATSPGVVVGTTAYMSPEQACGQAADERSDVFALGSTLYEMLSGRRAFQGATRAETLSAVLSQEPAELRPPAEAGWPGGLTLIVSRCLEKSPAARFHSAHDLALALTAVSARSGTGACSCPWRARASWPADSFPAIPRSAAFRGWT